MGCGSSKGSNDELKIDEIEEKKRPAVQPAKDEVTAFHPRNRYAAASSPDEDDDDDDDDNENAPGDELARNRTTPAPLRKKAKRRDDDDDDDDEEGAAAFTPAKDKDIERLLQVYKDKPQSTALSSTLYTNKHTQAMRRNEANRGVSSPAAGTSTDLMPGTISRQKINMKAINGGDSDEEVEGEENNVEARINADVDAMGGSAFVLSHNPPSTMKKKPAPSNFRYDDGQSITPHARNFSGDEHHAQQQQQQHRSPHSNKPSSPMNFVPGSIDSTADDDSTEFNAMSTTIRNNDSNFSTRQNSHRGPTDRRKEQQQSLAVDDEFDF